MCWSCGHGFLKTFVVCACKNTYYGLYGYYFIYLVSYCGVHGYFLMLCDLVMYSYCLSQILVIMLTHV
jgi:hypothetical protein